MIESKDEFNDLLNRLKAKDKENKLGKSLQTKLQAFLEVEELINLPISGVVGQSEQLFCPHCGNKLELIVETDLNSGRVCKSALCKGK